MADSDDRRFDEREVGAILRRVAELHESERDAADPRSMTRTEIERVVAELGISTALVARATSELSVRDVRNQSTWWVGGKTDVMFEETIAGKLDDATLTRMDEVLRRHLADTGTIRHEGGARIWATTPTGMRRVTFTVVEHEDTTTLRLEEAMSDGVARVMGTSFVGGFLGFMAMVPLKAILVKSVLLLAMGPLVLTGVLLGWLGGRTWWSRRAPVREAALRGIFDELTTLARSRTRALPPGDDPRT